MNRYEALEIADRLWEIVNGPAAGTTDPESLRRVESLTARIRDHPDLSAHLKLKADEVFYHARVLFDETALEDDIHGDVDIVAALARNAVIKLRLVAERHLPERPPESPTRAETEMGRLRRARRLLARGGLRIPLNPMGAA